MKIQAKRTQRTLERSGSKRRGKAHAAAHHPLLFLQQLAGNRATSHYLQAKLHINQPGDRYEQEADRMAEQVMSAPDGESSSVSNSSTQLQRKCSDCESEEREETLHFKPSPGQTPEVAPSTAARIDVLRGGGHPLPPTTRSFFESKFGYDFSDVRLHTGSGAAETARQLSAQAFTVGRDIVFGAGRYQPEAKGGRRLLAHELSHVVQQTGGAHSATGPNHIQRQPEPGPNIGPDLPKPPAPDFECSVDFFAGRWQDFLNCCAKTPLGRGCSKDLIKGAEELLKKKKTSPGPPPSPCPGRDTPFGTCCPVGQMWDGTKCAPLTVPPGFLCFPPERRSPDGRTCCEPDQIWDFLKRSCVPKPPAPPPKPPTPPTPPPVEIFFNKDRPRPGASGSPDLKESLTSEGRSHFDLLVKQLKENSALHVQLLGKASPEGSDQYNLELGQRRAEMIATALEAEGIAPSRIADTPAAGLPPGCVEVRSGVATCGEVGAKGPEDRQVLARIFSPRQ